MFKIYMRMRNHTENELVFDNVERACVAFFRNLSSRVQRIELHENTSNDQNEPSWRLVVHAIDAGNGEAFRITRVTNVF